VEKNTVRELRRCDERVDMFQCLVIYISRDNIYYVHARARYILLSHDSQAQSRGWRKSTFLEHFYWQVAARWLHGHRHSSPSPSPSRRRDNMDRASQVLAQGVPPGVPIDHTVLLQIMATSLILHSMTQSSALPNRNQQYSFHKRLAGLPRCQLQHATTMAVQLNR
jgi:hypothetical protein